MSGYYTYLISSLPMLHFTAREPFSTKKFLAICSELLSCQDMDALKNSMDEGREDYAGPSPIFKIWREFEIALRNELVKIRASRKHIDASRFLRSDGYADTWITHIAASACRAQPAIEAERMLDQERWRVLDGLSIGHYFDLELLIIYGQKLLILERWERVRTADGAKLLEETLS